MRQLHTSKLSFGLGRSTNYKNQDLSILYVADGGEDKIVGITMNSRRRGRGGRKGEER